MKDTDNIPCINPIEDQRAEALRHYEEVSSKAHHWSSFVEAAIKAYNPESKLPPLSKEQSIPERIEVDNFYSDETVFGKDVVKPYYHFNFKSGFIPRHKIPEIKQAIESCLNKTEQVASYDGVYFKTKQGARLYTQKEVDAIREETWNAARATNPMSGMKYDTFQDYLQSLTKDKEVDTGKCICKDGQPYSNLGCPIHGFTEFEKIEPTKSEAPTGKDSKEWDIVSMRHSQNGEIHPYKKGCENATPPCTIHSVKRKSDGEVFTVGDTVLWDDKPIVINGFEINYGNHSVKSAMMFYNRKGNNCNIFYAKKLPNQSPQVVSTNNDDVPCLSLNDVVGRFLGRMVMGDREYLQNLIKEKLKTK